jgi:hypothetical protein
MMHRNILALSLLGAILLGLIATGMVVRGNEQHPNVLPEPDTLPQPDSLRQSAMIWEYKTICVQGPFANAAHTLNEYGKRGWEVVDWEDNGFRHYLLKRQAAKSDSDGR